MIRRLNINVTHGEQQTITRLALARLSFHYSWEISSADLKIAPELCRQSIDFYYALLS